MNIGRVHARFTTVTARPFGFWAHQTNTGAAGVVVHLPVGGEEHGHVVVGEKIRRAMGAVDHSQGPLFAQPGFETFRDRHLAGGAAIFRKVQHIPGAQGTTAVAAKLAQGKGAA